MKNSVLPDREFLLEILRYDGEKLIWVKPPRNKEFLIGTSPKANDGRYRMITIGGKAYKAHRVIWKMVYGTEPEQIDHVSRDGFDNRIDNLRESDSEHNHRNRGNTRHPNLPFGVDVSKGGRFRAQGWRHKRTCYLGTFDTIEEAACVARKFKGETNASRH